MARGQYSHVEGYNGLALGIASHAEGQETVAYGDYSHAEGYKTTASGYQHVQGRLNVNGSGGDLSNTNGDAFIIGNGQQTTQMVGGRPQILDIKSNAFRVTFAGDTYGQAAYNATGADYAEYFEWLDGNPNNEDRRGLFVTTVGKKIKLAQENDFIVGVVSANPCVIGNSDPEWVGRFEKDEFGAYIIEKIEVFNEETGEKEIIEQYRLNPNFDESRKYIQRKDRQEWAAIGFMGQLVVVDDGTCEVDGFCKVGENGKATKADSKVDAYRVLDRINENLILVLVK